MDKNMGFKSGFVSIVGRTNVGKSTLLNKIIGQKIVITSDKPQTTRQNLKGVYTNDEGQIVFIDTPGVHKPKYKLGEFLAEETKSAIPDVDVVLFLVDGSVPAGSGDKWIVENLLSKEQKIILVINKVDLIKDLKKREEGHHLYPFKKFEVSKNNNCIIVFIFNTTKDTIFNNNFNTITFCKSNSTTTAFSIVTNKCRIFNC